MEKRVYIKTFGCQMNEHDSERMLALLAGCGYQETKRWDEADLILVNTCTVREKPEQKAYSFVGRFQRLKENNPDVIVGVAGCVAQQGGERLLARIPGLDFVIGPGKIYRLPEILHDVEKGRKGACAVGFEDGSSVHLPISHSQQLRAYVTIMQGCDNFCSYCVVPSVRGRERSRPSSEVLAEIESLVQRGTKEVILLGQNVNSYAKNNPHELTFPQLLAKINEIPGLERIRFTTSHPKDLTEEVILTFGKLKHLCEHFHLPFQAGSNAVLERMNRGHTREEYLAKAKRLREATPQISITADVMVGFPGEREEDFSQTLELIQDVEFDGLFSFKYSPREGTQAAQWKDDITPEIKQRRLEVLQELQREITLKRNKKLEGAVREVLVEGRSRNSPHTMMGRIRCNRIVNFPGGPEVVGELVKVKINEGLQNSLRGELCR
ncbi:MAG: tRNA (N6-isopentenyl adenosine(37)-C2)-methylthiotransferase MiaB [Deltaproteobacteria bacterium RBG_13_52_11]|nr:MAG: tRNA (N6-isopentenyl adenosine(37)-C2)-methylthiotransferase MiaB [Deltaproteobacteria bacterium RBG_13_52_11]